jgi:hypothetical protein
MTGMAVYVVDTIGPRLEMLAFESEAKAHIAMEEGARRAEAAARANAPWEDRTGDARYGLTAEVYDEAGEIVLELYHTVDYGQWLELIQDGRFAVIMPTLEALSGEILLSAGAVVIGSAE